MWSWKAQTMRCWAAVLPLLLAAWTAACGGGGDSVEKPFSAVSLTTAVSYRVQRLAGGPAQMELKRVGPVTFNGAAWDHFCGTYDVEQGVKSVDLYGTLISNTAATVAGYRVNYPEGSAEVGYTVALDQPQTLDAEQIPLGVPQTREVSGRIELDGGAGTYPAKVVAHYTKTEENAVLDSGLGAVSGVQVFSGDMTLTEGEGWALLDLFKGKTVTGRVWFHPTFSIMKIEVDGWPLGADLAGEGDCGNPAAADYNTIQRVGVVSPENRRFELSSFGCSGEFDADKMRHAQMLLELRWADGDKAKSSDQPQVEVRFETVWGYFPHVLLPSPASIFHPEENGQGYRYWYALVDEGAKNEPGENGISYGIRVDFPDYMTSPVRATARIRYPVYRP